MVNLMERYKNVVARFQDVAVTDTAIIEKMENGRGYIVTYNYMTSPCSGGIFERLEDAEETIVGLRKTAYKHLDTFKIDKCNSICNGCKNCECAGTVEKVWTGCVYRR